MLIFSLGFLYLYLWGTFAHHNSYFFTILINFNTIILASEKEMENVSSSIFWRNSYMSFFCNVVSKSLELIYLGWCYLGWRNFNYKYSILK